MSQQDLEDQIAFLAQIDRLKTVLRQSRIASNDRPENSAEHSWHLAMFALVLGPGRKGVEPARVIAMLLIHDIVEIDAGDAPLHGDYDRQALAKAEAAAAERLFGLLPSGQAAQFLALWREFEEAESPDARFAKALDRLQPLLLNTLTSGGTWAQNGVSRQDVYERYGPVIEQGSPDLWRWASAAVAKHFELQETTQAPAPPPSR